METARAACADAVVEAMARATSRKIVWIEDSNRLTKSNAKSKTMTFCRGQSSFKTRRTKSTGSVLENLRLHMRIAALKLSVVRSSSSKQQANVINVESAVFVCCARCDALSHGRVLRSELATWLNRGCAVGGAIDTSRFIKESEAFVVLLTDGILTDPNAIVSWAISQTCVADTAFGRADKRR